MPTNTIIERTLYVAKCPKCGDSVERFDIARERLCLQCHIWVTYVKESWTGPTFEHLPPPEFEPYSESRLHHPLCNHIGRPRAGCIRCEQIYFRDAESWKERMER